MDQSGKLEHLDTDTVIAFANGKSGALKIVAGVKRKLMFVLKRSVIPHDQIKPLVFAICVYLLVKDVSEKVILEIDEEYTGKEAIISEVLGKLLKKRWSVKWKGEIEFKLIGKESPAHLLAWNAHRFPKKYVLRKVGLEEVLKLFKLKKSG